MAKTPRESPGNALRVGGETYRTHLGAMEREANRSTIELSLEGTRRESTGDEDEPDHALAVRLNAY